MSDFYLIAQQEKLNRKKQALSGSVSTKDIFKELFGINLDYPQWGDATATGKKVAEILKVSDQTVKKWHKKDPETGEVAYFAQIPEDRKAALWYYYLAILPRSPIEMNK
jgi:hypothetical protein